MAEQETDPPGRAVLVIAHPGHELRLFGWMERARPCICVLTDGPALDNTLDVLERAGARVGAIFGRLSDARLRQCGPGDEILGGLANELAEWLIAERVVWVAGDAAEGYDPAHDTCRRLIDTALARVEAAVGLAPLSLDFALTGPPDACPGPRSRLLHLADDSFARKQAAALRHPGLAAEAGGVFRVECLRPAPRFRERVGGVRKAA